MSSDIHVRVVSNRKGGVRSLPGESVVDCSRTNPVLGNPFYLEHPTDPGARERCIARFSKMADQDMAHGGPISRAIASLGERAARGERLALACWCAPLPCHADHIARLVREAAWHNRKKQS